MSIVKSGASAFGKLFIVIALAGMFVVGMVGVVYMSLQGDEIKVPDIVGKDFTASEDELASLGLRIKKRADRFSNEKPNTILEQLPKAGEIVKTGQMVLVVRSKTNPDGDEKPVTIKKNDDDEDDSEKIEELISDKPKPNKKTNTNSNKKKTSTTRDVLSSNGDNSNDNSSDSGNSNKKESNSNDNSSKINKGGTTNSNSKPAASTESKKEPEPKKSTENDKPKPAKTPAGGDVRPRKTPQP